MSRPTTASRSIEIEASPEAVYDLVADVTRSGEWSPECVSCEWLSEPGQVGATFKGRNRQGPVRWTTTARVLVADRPGCFEFATLHRDAPSTKWRYSIEPAGDGATALTETFEAITAPWLIDLAERLFLRNRQQQLESGITASLARIKAIAEGDAPAG
jgi:hypothetical protein